MEKNEFIELCKLGKLSALQDEIANSENKYPRNCLAAAVTIASRYGHLDIIKLSVATGGSDILNVARNAVGLAARNGHLSIVKYLLSHGVNANGCGGYAVQWASRNCHIDTLKCLLLADGVSDRYYSKSITAAAEGGSVEIMELLIANKPKTLTTNYNQALQTASRFGHLELVSMLVNNGADLHNREERAARLACRAGRLAVVKFLVSRGARIYTGSQHECAVRWALSNNHTEVVNYLEMLAIIGKLC